VTTVQAATARTMILPAHPARRAHLRPVTPQAQVRRPAQAIRRQVKMTAEGRRR